MLESTTRRCPTIAHVPKKSRTGFSKSFCSILEAINADPSVPNVESLLAFAKSTLAAPARNNRVHGKEFAKLIDDRLAKWDNGDRGSLWKDVCSSLQPSRRRNSKAPPKDSSPDHTHRLAIKAAQDGQYKKAAKILSSHGIATPSAAVKSALEDLHPVKDPPIIPDEPPPPASSFSEDDVRKAVSSFPEGTAPGPSGFRASYLKQAINCPSGSQANRTLRALTAFVNNAAAGKLPLEAASFFCGASLHAANKKTPGTYRPIAVGEVLRRLVAKCLAFKLSPQASTFLQPRQVGVKTRGGTEAVIHSVQAILNNPAIPANSKWVVQIDFKNAFNTIDRSTFLAEVRKCLPGLSAFVEWCYGANSRLVFGEDIIYSSTGVQQGDPLGPLLFAICLHLLIRRIEEAAPDLLINVWYLDDGVLVGDPKSVLAAFEAIKELSPTLGLELNLEKSTLWRCPEARADQTQSSINTIVQLGIPEVQPDGFVLLGAPVGNEAFARATVAARVEKLAELLVKVSSLQNPQIQLSLVRSCFGLPKFAYCLRTCDPASVIDEFGSFDTAQCRALSDIAGTPLSTQDPAWILASLPVSLGGLGLRSAAIHSPAAFVASNLQTSKLVEKIITPHKTLRDITAATSLLTNNSANATTPLPDEGLTAKTPQKLLSRRIDESRLHLLENLDTGDRFPIVLQSVRQQGTGAFLNVVPSPTLGLYIPPREFTLAIKYRLGLPVYPNPGPCPLCQKDSDIYGDHAISACIVSGDRTRRHDNLVNAIYERSQSALLHPTKEERNLLDDRSRPGDITFERSWPHCPGKTKIALDVTVVSPFRQDSRSHSATDATFVLRKAREQKFRKYDGKLPFGVGLIPLPVTTFGLWEENAAANLLEIVNIQSSNLRGDKKNNKRHFFERLSVTLQRENGSMLLERCPLPAADVDGEI